MTTKTVDVAEAQGKLVELLALVAGGTEIALTEGEMPIARIVPQPAPPPASGKPRIPGLQAGEVWMSADFDEPMVLVNESTHIHMDDLKGLWTDAQYLRLTNQTNRLIELTDGVLEVLPMPTRKHQRIVRLLFQ